MASRKLVGAACGVDFVTEGGAVLLLHRTGTITVGPGELDDWSQVWVAAHRQAEATPWTPEGFLRRLIRNEPFTLPQGSVASSRPPAALYPWQSLPPITCSECPELADGWVIGTGCFGFYVVAPVCGLHDDAVSWRWVDDEASPIGCSYVDAMRMTWRGFFVCRPWNWVRRRLIPQWALDHIVDPIGYRLRSHAANEPAGLTGERGANG